jgi:DnaJ-domain-containing protein 1
MIPTHYELLGIDSTASVDEIRRAFRREIAKYHPDKVQHLGHEFQDIAAIRSAELTQAYKTLTDEGLRAVYDAAVRSDAPSLDPTAAHVESATAAVRTGVSDLVRKAAVFRFRQALQAAFGFCEEAATEGFELVCAPSKARFWSKLPPRVYVRFVSYVDGAAVGEGLRMVLRPLDKDYDRGRCLFVIGPHVAPARELALAIAKERRKSAVAGLSVTIVPVNTRTWAAYMPHDAPSAVRSLISLLRPS